MTKQYKTAAAFRTSLEARLKALAKAREGPLLALRLKVVMERLLARLFLAKEPGWLLKGGCAMEFRFRPRARATNDVDLSVGPDNTPREPDQRAEQLGVRLQQAIAVDTGDHFRFRVGAPQRELKGAPLGGARFLCEAILADKSYAKFHIDIGCGDVVLGEPEALTGAGFLAFAGIAPPRVLAIPAAQQFAEKVHAYTLPWNDRVNTRTKDLVDLVLFLETGPPAGVADAIRVTFAARNSHPLPPALAPPPESWKDDYAAMAAEARLASADYRDGFAALERFWADERLAQSP